jgi:hypothetical protein
MSMLNRINYLVFQIKKSTDGRHLANLEPITEFPLDIWTKAQAEACDYLFIPGDKENQIAKMGALAS